jgi:hypothetical protein
MARAYRDRRYPAGRSIPTQLRHRLEHGHGLHAQSSIRIIWIKRAHVFAPGVAGIWAVIFAAMFTFLNIQGWLPRG